MELWPGIHNLEASRVSNVYGTPVNDGARRCADLGATA
jgi:hypothetical protein